MAESEEVEKERSCGSQGHLPAGRRPLTENKHKATHLFNNFSIEKPSAKSVAVYCVKEGYYD